MERATDNRYSAEDCMSHTYLLSLVERQGAITSAFNGRVAQSGSICHVTSHLMP